MKTTFRFEFSILFYLGSLICIFTGLFKDFLFFTLLIMVHELGHILMATYFHWNIKKVVFYPFGGMTFFDELENRPIQEEEWILWMGPIFQILFFHVFYSFFPMPLFKRYHYVLLLFNLLPIYPLDGGKLWMLFFHHFFPFLTVHTYTYFFSFVFCFLFGFLFFKMSHSVFFLFIFFSLFKDICLAYQTRKYRFHKFLFERLFYSFSFPKCKQIEGIFVKKMQRDCVHWFKRGENIYFEREILKKMFDTKE